LRCAGRSRCPVLDCPAGRQRWPAIHRGHHRSHRPLSCNGSTTVLKSMPAPASRLLLAMSSAALVAIVMGGICLYCPDALASEGLCAEESIVRSVGTIEQTVLIFNNKTAAPIKLFWIDFRGERKPYGEVPSGGNGRRITIVGHIWVVADARGSCLGLYRAEAGDREITIEP